MNYLYQKFTKEMLAFTFIGFIIGLFFPIFSFIFLLIENNLEITITNVIILQSENPIIILIELAPIILGFFGYMIGVRQIQIIRSYESILAINKASQSFIPSEFLYLLNKSDISKVKSGDHVDREMTILFTDIRSYSSIAENLSSEETLSLLNEYLEIASKSIFANKGFIDKFIGDSIMAIFPDSPDDALKCAIEMKKSLEIFNEKRIKNNQKVIKTGFGIHTGKVSIGVVGNSFRMDTTVIGDTVNVAARIEEWTKIFSSWILLSENTAIKLDQTHTFHIREIDIVKHKNRENVMAIYECYDIDLPQVIQKKDNYKLDMIMGMAMFRENEFKEAESIFRHCLKSCPEDPIPVIYINRCHERNSDAAELEIKPKSLSVLLIDDNDMIIILVEKFLRKHGFKVISANSGVQAVAIYKNFSPDVVLMDLHFPDMNGYDIFEKLKETEFQKDKQFKIILMTADDSVETINRAEELKFDGILFKPIFEQPLIEKINEVLKSPIND